MGFVSISVALHLHLIHGKCMLSHYHNASACFSLCKGFFTFFIHMMCSDSQVRNLRQPQEKILKNAASLFELNPQLSIWLKNDTFHVSCQVLFITLKVKW